MHAVLFASDFDGTLSHGQEIDAQTLAAVSRFRQKGGRFGVCSGRDPGTLKDELSQHGLACDFLILMNGARIEAGADCLQEKLLSGWEKALPLLRARCLFFTMLSREEAYMFRSGKVRTAEVSAGEQAYIDAIGRMYAMRRCAEELAAVYQISCRTQDGRAAVTLADELHRFGLSAWPNCESVDVVPKGVGKAPAVAAVAAHFGVASGRVYTAGDGRNDMEMLSRFRGFAMSRAEECVRRAASWTVKTVGEALEQVCGEAFA